MAFTDISVVYYL